MKKCILLVAMLMSINSYAQFTTYEPVIVDGNGNWVNRNSGSYPNYSPDNYRAPQRAPQRSQQNNPIISTRGYYFKDKELKTVLLRVKMIDDNLYVVGIKRNSTGWSNTKTKVSSTQFMQKEIRDIFDYYIRDYNYGIIYF